MKPVRKYTSKTFDYEKDFRRIDFRKNPELYQIGRGEQGVLMVEPYKSEILPYWKFKTPAIAKASSEKIFDLFLKYLEQVDFVGADMARKFLQMGYTRSRRYANHKGGRKYYRNPQMEKTIQKEKEARKKIRPFINDPEKAASARLFKLKWEEAKANEKYLDLKEKHKDRT